MSQYHRTRTLNPVYANPYGRWKVTTTGTGMGENLGYWEGNIDEIALHLADQTAYALCFTRLLDTNEIDLAPTRAEVEVQLDIESGTWDMTPEERLRYVAQAFKGANRPVTIEDGSYYATFKIVGKDPEEIKRDILRRKALSKLTSEEKAALGLPKGD